jgi:hypothetical protein
MLFATPLLDVSGPRNIGSIPPSEEALHERSQSITLGADLVIEILEHIQRLGWLGFAFLAVGVRDRPKGRAMNYYLSNTLADFTLTLIHTESPINS